MQTHRLKALVEYASNDEVLRALLKVTVEAANDHPRSTETYHWGWDDAMQHVKEIMAEEALAPRSALLSVVAATDETRPEWDVNMAGGWDDAMSKVRDLVEGALR